MATPTKVMLLVFWALVGFAGAGGCGSARAADASPPRGAVLTLGRPGMPASQENLGTIGLHVTANDLREVLPTLRDEGVDVVVLRLESGGGLGAAAFELADVIDEDLDPEFRTIVWIAQATRAAAIVALAADEIMMNPSAILGAIGGSTDEGPNAVIERRLIEIAQRNGRSPLLARSMHYAYPLSYTPRAGGGVEWFDHRGGEVDLGDFMLALNAEAAHDCGLSLATCDTLDDVSTALDLQGIEWVGDPDPALPWPVSAAARALDEQAQAAQVAAARLGELYVQAESQRFGPGDAAPTLDAMARLLEDWPRLAWQLGLGSAEEFAGWRKTFTSLANDIPSNGATRSAPIASPVAAEPARPVPLRSAILTLGSRGDAENESSVPGIHITANDLIDIIPDLRAERVELVALRLDADAHWLHGAFEFIEAIDQTLDPEFRVVLWVTHATGPAAAIALAGDDVVMSSGAEVGHFTNVRGWWGDGSGDLGEVLLAVEEVALRNAKPVELARAMVINEPLSYTRRAANSVDWCQGLEGEVVLGDGSYMIKLDAPTAEACGFSAGTCDDYSGLPAILELDEVEWVGREVEGVAWPVSEAERVLRERVGAAQAAERELMDLHAGFMAYGGVHSPESRAKVAEILERMRTIVHAMPAFGLMMGFGDLAEF